MSTNWKKRNADPEHVQCDWCSRFAAPEYTINFGTGIDEGIQACADHRENYATALDLHYWDEADRESNPEEYR